MTFKSTILQTLLHLLFQFVSGPDPTVESTMLKISKICLTFSQPAVECILPELSKHWRGSHFRGREIQQEFSQTWDDRFLNAKSDGSGTEAEL